MNEHFHFVEDCICLLVCKHASKTAKLSRNISVFLIFSVIFGKIVSQTQFVNMAVCRFTSPNLFLS